MKGYVTNIEDDTMKNKDFRRVLYTGKNSQLVLMSLRPKEEIGLETHSLDQFIRVEAGRGIAVLDGVEHQIADGTAVVIPAGTKHNVINHSEREELKLYTLYSPPEHR
ncbi:MAG TPA: cupin domain-containing protein, partial [Candidatus Binatia bacterium]